VDDYQSMPLGYLPDIDEVAWSLRVPPEELIADLRELERRGLFYEIIDDDYKALRWYTPFYKELGIERKITRRQFDLQRRHLFHELVNRDGEYCQHCGETSNLAVDHIVAIANGGGNDLENLQILCKSCNSRKGTK
jgi:hypothetical protein